MSNVPFSKSRHLSLFVLIPVIFTGLSILSGIVAFHYSKYYLKGLKPSWDITLWLVAIIGFTFICGLLITWLLLKPVKTFIKEAEKLPIFSGTLSDKKSLNVNEIDHFNMVFREVTNLLGKVEAKELFPEIIGQSNVMRGLFSQILKVASTDATVLIMGDSGTGKELIATSIYEHSRRKNEPFVKLSCVAIPEGLLESELFGHEKGAFTGATARKIGKFELAHNGTILLDEIGDMPLETQAKLLRVLQEKEFERVGGTRPIKVDVRFIAATNKDLQGMVKEGKFREDLFYRINAFMIVLPSLAERREDIPLLISHFLEFAPRPARLSSDALQILMNYSWPGNVRELKNTVERTALMAEDGIIEPPDIPANILTDSGMDRIDYRRDRKSEKESHTDEKISIDERLRDLEIKMIIEALLSTQGVQARAAEQLGIKERSLWHRIKKYEIDISTLKEGK
ncbi:MAG: sigma-54-dependent Fis family transcriptional regulator [Deltaproteobacteria bacterium]|nr:sigma-54-dependent Fis family transcriptional regulator [Deltaproteobacteria bacterium]